MDPLEISNRLINTTRLSVNEDYYNLVFKKTERIVSVVFYILSFIETTEDSVSHKRRLTEKAYLTHDLVTDSLSWPLYSVTDKIPTLQQALVVLASALTMMTGARLISEAVAESVQSELDDVLRYLKNHYNNESIMNRSTSSTPTLKGDQRSEKRARRQRPQIPPHDMSSEAILVYSQLSDRTTRIKTVLEAKPEATIKDLTDIITDVSAKTIQRDLNDMIAMGQIIRQGERRWSKYSLAKK